MTETFTFEPTGYKVERQKQAKQSPKRLAQEFKKQYAIAMRSATAGKQTTGGQLVGFRNAARVCKLYGQPIPDDLKCLISLYQNAEENHNNARV